MRWSAARREQLENKDALDNDKRIGSSLGRRSVQVHQIWSVRGLMQVGIIVVGAERVQIPASKSLSSNYGAPSIPWITVSYYYLHPGEQIIYLSVDG